MEPFQEKFTVILSSGVANGGDFKTVPAGKRAVIEHVSVYDTGTGANTADYFFTSTIGDNSMFMEVPIVTRMGALGIIGSHSFRAFAAPGTEFGGVVRRLDTTGMIQASIVVAGYYEPVP
jgi:hypothetical protein